MTHALPEVRPEPPREPVLSFRSFSDLGALPPEPDWIWNGIIARGALTMLAGHPYVGKTMLVSGLLKAVESGFQFMGRETQQATALLVTEEHEVTLRPRVEQLQLQELRSELVSRGDGIFRVDWPTLIDDATGRALELGHGLLIIDTFAGLAGLQAEEENDAGAISERLHPLQAAAGEGLAVLFLHHLNKNGQPRGSTAFRGVTDTSIRMQREKGKKDFHLRIESRFLSPPSLRGRLTTTGDGLTYVGMAGNELPGLKAAIESTDDRLLEALRSSGTAGLTYEEIGAIPELSQDKAKRRLPDWYEKGQISRERSGVKSDPYRWFAHPS